MDYEMGAYEYLGNGTDYQKVIYFDGQDWWLPGWECPLSVGGQSEDESNIGARLIKINGEEL